jgi:hypothetical protein
MIQSNASCVWYMYADSTFVIYLPGSMTTSTLIKLHVIIRVALV